MEWFVKFQELMGIIPVVFIALKAISTITPTPVDNVALVTAKQIFDVLVLDVGKAKNAAAKEAQETRYISTIKS